MSQTDCQVKAFVGNSIFLAFGIQRFILHNLGESSTSMLSRKGCLYVNKII